MFIPDPDFCPSRIPSPKFQKQHQKIGVKKKILSYLFLATKFKIILFLNLNLGQFTRIIELFTQKIGIKLSKI